MSRLMLSRTVSPSNCLLTFRSSMTFFMAVFPPSCTKNAAADQQRRLWSKNIYHWARSGRPRPMRTVPNRMSCLESLYSKDYFYYSYWPFHKFGCWKQPGFKWPTYKTWAFNSINKATEVATAHGAVCGIRPGCPYGLGRRAWHGGGRILLRKDSVHHSNWDASFYQESFRLSIIFRLNSCLSTRQKFTLCSWFT